MKVGFIGTGRMGQAMVRRMIEAKHEVGVYNRTAAKAKPLADAGAKILPSVAEAARFGEVAYTMLADDAALEDVLFQSGGLRRIPGRLFTFFRREGRPAGNVDHLEIHTAHAGNHIGHRVRGSPAQGNGGHEQKQMHPYRNPC